MKKERKEERMEERKEKANKKGVVKMEKERELVKENNENKGVVKMEKERELVKENNENKGVVKMKKESKELIKEIEAKKLLLVEKVLQWAEILNPIRDIHVKIKGRYYPLLGKDGKLFVIDKVEGKKVPFNTLDDSFKFVISAVLAERKEQIEKEVKEDKRKYLEKKLEEVNNLLNKF